MNLVSEVILRIKPEFEKDASGHDWHHIMRVYNTACYIQEKEGGNREIVELAALLHDISDHKMNGGKLNAGGAVAYDILIDLGASEETASQVRSIVDKVSFKGAKTEDGMTELEGMIVQDADRLDAIGAIGIARTFAYGGHKGQSMYDPELEVVLHTSFEQYANARSSTINHFYEKLLLLAERLNTPTAREIGKERHAFMEQFLEHFYNEWNFNASTRNG